MQSPKFDFIRDDLNDAFSPSLLKTEWKKRVKQQIRKQLVFDAIEYRDIDAEISSTIERVRRDITSGDYIVRQPKRYLAEKSKGLCRQMTLIHPRDLLVLERLSRSIYFELKSKSPSKSAFFEPDDGNFSKGFKQEDFEYGSFESWKKFQKSVFGFADENKFIVITDVANFYDFVNFQHLRNIVASLASIRESLLDLLIHVLNRLTWTPDFMPLSQVGMPQIETTATRVLANAMLYEVDKVCEKSAASNYARFMDDMDIGVEKLSIAKRIIRDVDLTLQSRQLRLNSAKTKILSRKEAYDHFRIEENKILTLFDGWIKAKVVPKLVRKIIQARYSKWLDRTPSGGPGENSRFVGGNGNKIHKYVLSLLYESGARAADDELLWLVRNDPGMRSTALRYLSRSQKPNSNLAVIVGMVHQGIFVDDAAFVDIAGHLLHTKFRKTAKCEKLVEDFCATSCDHSDIALQSCIFVSSRFLPPSKVLKILENNVLRISGDFWLSRAAGGLAPVFRNTSDWLAYKNLILELDSSDARNVFDYLCRVMNDQNYNQSLKSYLSVPNHSFPQGLYFPKVLTLLAAVKNPNSATLVPNIHSQHPALLNDPYYRGMGFGVSASTDH